MPGPWTDATDRQLLLIIIHLTGGQLPKWEKVAALMGNGFTAESTRQHFQKLRKESTAQFGAPAAATANGVSTPNGAGTPNGKAGGAGVRTPGKSTGKRKGKKAAAEVEDGEDEGGSPSKKTKVEDEEDDGDFH